MEARMAPRPHWKGYLKLSLVSCPISLYPAISAGQNVSFRQVNRDTGHRLRQQLVDSVTGDVVDSSRKGRGYEVDEDKFLLIPDEDLKSAQQEARERPFSSARTRPIGKPEQVEEPAPGRDRKRRERGSAPAFEPVPVQPRPIVENNRTIELDRFVPNEQIDPRYHLSPYYIAPRDQVGQEAYAVIRDAMARKGLVGIGRIVLSNRERPILVEPMGSGLRGITLRYAHEVRSETEYFADIPQMKLPDEMVRITEHILESKKEDFDPAYLEDRYRTVLVENLREKQAEMRRSAAPPSAQNVIDLMDALKRSLATEPPVPRSTSRRSAAAAVQPPPAKRSPRRSRAAD
jgi:DNA end-binding protein Ku